jgi:hypothetical protein
MMLVVSKIRIILSVNVSMDLVEVFAKIVNTNENILQKNNVLLLFFFMKIKDNSCWNNPCEGCQKLFPNSTEYLCTCSKFSASKCVSEIKRKFKKIDLK